jgi:predicted dithiol-disulfide oxidoreductase (DUF899 family)
VIDHALKQHRIASREERLAARKARLKSAKALTRVRNLVAKRPRRRCQNVSNNWQGGPS